MVSKEKMVLNKNNELSSSKHIFIIWENSLFKSEAIIELINKKFQITDIYQMKWQKKYFTENIRRFYGATLPDPVKKTKTCGTGEFLVILVIDHNPNFKKRGTSYGPQIVNANIYDEKFKYRKLIGGAFAIHGSNTEKETNHDLTLLLGKNLNDVFPDDAKKWDNKFQKISRDLIGFDGWENSEELFFVLNNTTEYLVLRNFENLHDEPTSKIHRDIDFLTDDLWQIPYIVNKKNIKISDKIIPRVKIDGKFVAFDFRYPGDHYYDKKWAKDMLERRIIENGIYVPSKEDYLYGLIYHMLIHKKKISEDYISKIKAISDQVPIKIQEEKMKDQAYLKKILNEFMKSKGYKYTNSLSYKMLNNESTRLITVGIKIVKKRGMKSFLKAVKGKMYRNKLKKSGQI